MGDRAGDGDLTDPLVCECPVPFDVGCDGECPLMELDTATFLGVEPFEMLANPFDVVRVPLSSGRMLFSAKRLRFAGGLCSGPPTLGPGISAPSTPIALEPAVNESAPKPSDLWGEMGDERRRRRRELRGTGSWSAGAACDRFAGSVGNTMARMERVEVGNESSVSVDWSGLLGMSGSSVADGAVLFGMLSSARSTERQSRRTWRE
jgi:hypothetical protein